MYEGAILSTQIVLLHFNEISFWEVHQLIDVWNMNMMANFNLSWINMIVSPNVKVVE